MLRDYQQALEDKIYAAWATGARNVMATMATGGGKSVVIGDIIRKENAPAAVIAHRSELVSQLSLTLNREEIPHSVIAPNEIIRQIVALEVETHGRSFYRVGASVRVASAHTLAVRDHTKDRWYQQCRLAIVDEGHHVTRLSVWDRALQLLPNARGLFKTAHAVRADGKGLGRPADGLVDALVTGAHGRDLIDRGYLCDYRIIVPPTDIDVSDIPIGPGGDLNQQKLSARVHGSKTIVGDVVGHYQRHAAGKLGLTFAVDIAAATEIRAAFEKVGVPAEVVTAKTPIPVRAAVMRRFRARQILQLVSVDVLGEGVDVPAVEVVQLVRHTASWQLYCQQVGRALRPFITDARAWAQWDAIGDEGRRAAIAASSKPKALIIDHVDNFRRMAASIGPDGRQRGTFDSPQTYSLNRRESRKKKQDDAIPLRICQNDGCFQPYEAFLLACPYCGTPKPVPGQRSTPEQVEGDLIELDPTVLQAMRNEVLNVDGPPPVHGGGVIGNSIAKQHTLRQWAQAALRPTIALFAGWQRSLGRTDREIHQIFFHRFGTDVMTAQTLGVADAEPLQDKIQAALNAAGVVST